MIYALTFDAKLDGWENSKGFVKRKIPMPALNEQKEPQDAVAVLIRVKYAGVCGSDRGIWNREVFYSLLHDSLKREGKTQRIVGHEFVGEVIEAGLQVENLYGIKVGDNVSGDSHVTCGRCFQCRIGQQEVCQDQAILGISRDGVFAEYIKIPAKNLWQVDFSRIRPEITSIFDPFGNAVHACSKVDLQGKRIAILGCGPIGMFTILLGRAFGAAKVIAVDINKKNIEIAKRLGADYTLLADDKLCKEVSKLTYGKGVDIVFEMAGPNSSVVNALEITRSGGEVILFGLKDGDFMIPGFHSIIVKGLTLYGVIGRRIFETWQTSQRILSDKENRVQEKIWKIILRGGEDTILPFDEYTPERFEEMMKRRPKILIRF